MIKEFVRTTSKMLLAGGILVLSLAVTGCGGGADASNAASGKTDVLRIGAQPYPLYADVYVAKEKGYLDEELKKVGAKYEWKDFKSGPLVNEAVASGHEDIGFMADMPAILAKSSGQDIKIIDDVAYGEKGLALIVKPDSSIKTVADLKGKKVAYMKGSYSQHLMSLLLKQAGLSFDDIQAVNIAAGDVPAALENGQIDASVIWEQFISQLVLQDKARVVADGTGLKRGNLVTYAVADYAEAHPDVIAAYIKACQRGGAYIKENPADAAKLISKDLKTEPEVLESVFRNMHYDSALTAADVAEIKKVKDYLLQEHMIDKDIDMDAFIDLSYLQKAGIQ